MSLAIVHSRAQEGIFAPAVCVEVHLASGLPRFSIVGLPETTVTESKDRVRAALLTAHYKFPAQRITVNLAPADLPKEGGRFDLPIALGILAASAQLPKDALEDFEFIGELGLGGELRPVRGVLPVALQAAKVQRQLVVPLENADEAALVGEVTVLAAGHLLQVCAHIIGTEKLSVRRGQVATQALDDHLDLADVKGQHRAKRALEIAAAGHHNLLMIGPPGTGKTMLAHRMITIMPQLTQEQAIETAAIASISSQGFDPKNWLERPFRSPHHTTSGIALVGGGSHPKPGEISLAHHGVLFLDELTEFDRRVLEVLREPLENGRITISRAARQAEFPAKFQLIAAMNPCPQSFDCDLGANCRCTAEQQRRHRARISAPLLDRIDIHIDVPRIPQDVLRTSDQPKRQTSRQVRERVVVAQHRQLSRQGKLNGELTGRDLDAVCEISVGDSKILEQAMTRFKLSARAYHRILKIARTIADLDGSDYISTAHLSEALSYRALDRLL